MGRFLGRAITVLALCSAIGLHWMVLQSVAWTTMFVDYSKRAPFRQAIAQTLDGAHPCSLCHAVNKGKNSEKKPELQSLTFRIDMICAPNATGSFRPFVPFEYAPPNSSLSRIGHSPPVPPPRFLVS